MENKLQQGDYVKNLTRKQFNELVRIENKSFKITYEASASKAIRFQLGILLHGLGTTELTFEQFKQRAINTFQNAN